MVVKRSDIFTKLRKLEDQDSTEDYAVWEKLGVEAKFNAAWELVVDAYRLKGKSLDELRFQRSVTNLVKTSS